MNQPIVLCELESVVLCELKPLCSLVCLLFELLEHFEL